jgi:ferrochelatase
MISTRRSPGVIKQYEAIGGRSPIKEYTLQQAALLETRLNEHIPARVYVAMRYWRPSTDDALDALERDSIKKVILLPLYPQFSKATTVSSVKEWENRLKDRGETLDWSLIEYYYDHPTYVDAFVERVRQGLDRFPEDVRGSVSILFSAHGTPMKLVRQGDPYSDHISKTIAAIMHRGMFPQAHTLCYQSKVGPMKWLTPSTPDTIADLAKKGVKNMLIVPVAFASDHLETLFELGIEYRRQAGEHGVVQYEVTEGLNDSPKFIEALAELVFEKEGVHRRQADGAAAGQ